MSEILVDGDPTVFEPCLTCEHRSYVFFVLPSGRRGTLCGHHGGNALAKLYAEGARVLDLRHLVDA